MRVMQTTPRFERRLGVFLRKHRELKEVIQGTMREVVTGKDTMLLRMHKLKGYLRDCYAVSVSYEYRIVFVPSETMVTFVDIGTHDDVY